MRAIKKGATDQSVVIRIVDSGDGTPETSVEHDTSGIDLWYRREGATKTSITEAALASLDAAHSDGGIEHIGDGYYRLDLPDAACAAGANGVMVGGTVTDMVVIGCYVHLVDYDPQDAQRLGLASLPNANPAANGGLPTVDANNYIAGQQGTINTLDALDTAQDSQHSATQTLVQDVPTNAELASALDALPTAGEVADAVWDEAIAGHDNAGSTGEALGAAGSAGDPWTTALPGSYTAGQAGYIIGTNLDAAVSSRSALDASGVRDAVGLATANLDTQLGNVPTVSELEARTLAAADYATAANQTTIIGYVDLIDDATSGLAKIATDAAAALADTNEMQTDWADGGRLDAILDARASQASVDDLPTNAELATAITTALTTALTEGYRSTGATGSVRDLLYEILQNITEFTISGTTKTVKKLDGSTTAKTYTLNDGSTPTGITEAS